MDLTHPISSVIPSLEGRVLTVLARTSQPLTGRRVAQLVPDASRSGVQAALNRLVSHGLVVAEPYGHAVFYAANERHLMWEAVHALLQAAEALPRRLRELVRAEVESTLSQDEAAQTTVALYGSVARGTGTPESDVDLLVVTRHAEPDKDVEALVLRLIEDIPAATGNTCNVYLATRRDIDELVARGDPMVGSWLDDAEMISGPDICAPLEGAPWPA
ncbi:MAG: hypothetical protein HGA44_21440 [Cellulomonadaceae bacterium]|nr:hypothetical protein [Cellulomonadaceae bacterium]